MEKFDFYGDECFFYSAHLNHLTLINIHCWDVEINQVIRDLIPMCFVVFLIRGQGTNIHAMTRDFLE